MKMVDVRMARNMGEKEKLDSRLVLMNHIFEIKFENWYQFGRTQPIWPKLTKITSEVMRKVEKQVKPRDWTVFLIRKELVSSPKQDRLALGNKLYVTKERIRQIEKDIFKQIKKEVRNEIFRKDVIASLGNFSRSLISIEEVLVNDCNGINDHSLVSIDRRTRRLLNEQGIDTPDILTLWSANELLSIRGFSTKSLLQAQASLLLHDKYLRTN